MHINIYMLLKCVSVLDFLKLASMWAYPRVCGYPRIAGTGIILYPLRVAGAGADFSTRVRVYEVDIRADFIRCHLYLCPGRRALSSKKGVYMTTSCTPRIWSRICTKQKFQRCSLSLILQRRSTVLGGIICKR